MKALDQTLGLAYAVFKTDGGIRGKDIFFIFHPFHDAVSKWNEVLGIEFDLNFKCLGVMEAFILHVFTVELLPEEKANDFQRDCFLTVLQSMKVFILDWLKI